MSGGSFELKRYQLEDTAAAMYEEAQKEENPEVRAIMEQAAFHMSKSASLYHSVDYYCSGDIGEEGLIEKYKAWVKWSLEEFRFLFKEE